MIVYRLAQALARGAWRLVGDLDVQGLDNIPATGPGLIMANHQSYLDPVMVQAVVPRVVHGMAKSTQFATPVLGWILARHLAAFPVRRYRIDPQAVRLALRLLDDGRLVAIYVEGERSWDGRLQPPRLGALRLILKAGVPVVPCGITGSYDALPRWDRKLHRSDLRIRFGEPMRFPRSDDHRERNALLPDVRDRLMTEIARLMRADPVGRSVGGVGMDRG